MNLTCLKGNSTPIKVKRRQKPELKSPKKGKKEEFTY